MGINLKHNGAGAEVLYQLLLCEVITKHIKMLGVKDPLILLFHRKLTGNN